MASNPAPRAQPHLPARPNVLLTGFGPFPGMPRNASGDFAVALQAAAERQFRGHAFHCEILATEWREVPDRIGGLYADLKPVLALHFGVAQGVRGLRLERLARNACRTAGDAAGQLPSNDALIAGGPEAIAASLPVEAIYRRLMADGFPITISDDAGSYLCNAALYHALSHCEASGHRARVGFIHIASDLESQCASFALARDAALRIIDVTLQSTR